MFRRTARLILPILAAVLIGGTTLAQGVLTADPAGAATPVTFDVFASDATTVHGQEVTFTTTLSGPSGRPTGTVDFIADGVALCSSVDLTGHGEHRLSSVRHIDAHYRLAFRERDLQR